MYQPEAYAAALFFMIVSMVCWGSWANTMKLTPGYAFPLFYWDYLVGMVLGALVLGFHAGKFWRRRIVVPCGFYAARIPGTSFTRCSRGLFSTWQTCSWWRLSKSRAWRWPFPIGIGLALVVGALMNYLISPRGNPFLLFSGIVLVGAGDHL